MKEYRDDRLAQIEHLNELDLDETRPYLLTSFTLDQLAVGDVHGTVQVRSGGTSFLRGHLVVLVLSVGCLVSLLVKDFSESFAFLL